MKKAFTLMELIIVIGILAVILWISYIFRGNSESEKIKYWKECSKHIFQEVLNQNNNIKKNKIINSWDETILIKEIKIQPKSDGSWYHNWLYMTIINEKWEISEIKTLINDDWTCAADYILNKNKYKIETSNFLDNDELDNDEVKLQVCSPWGWNCSEITKIKYNKASNKFDLYFCALVNENYNTKWKCDKWEK